MMAWVRLVESWVLLPGGLLLLAGLGWLLLFWWKRLGRALVGIALFLLYLFSTPWMQFQLAAVTETIPALTSTQTVIAARQSEKTAIVVLGGGRYTDAPEFSSDVVNRYTLERLRYGAWLQRQINAPILVTGGFPLGESSSEAALMATSLQQDFGVAKDQIWLEEISRNTWEHGQYVPPILEKQRVTTVLLVTHASHMQRAVNVFEASKAAEGLKIVPAPTAFTTRGAMDHGALLFRPSTHAMHKNQQFLHEWLGQLWYAWHYR